MKKYLSMICILILITMVLSAVWMPVQAQDGVDDLQLVTQDGLLEWQTGWKDQVMLLTIGLPDNRVQEMTFKPGESVRLNLVGLTDGYYSFHLIGVPTVDYEVLNQASQTEDGRDKILIGLSDQETHIWDGSFSILKGEVYLPNANESIEDDAYQIKDELIERDDLIVQGSLCVGFDCVNGELFGSDTIRLKENNLRIKFEDTSSTAAFPTTDWQITINDSASGGASYFAIDDIDSGKTPFKIEANAPNNALFVAKYNGKIGFGTNTPILDLHITNGNTPGIRLDQDGSGGWGTYVWDVAANETNFFIRDVTGGSKLPFKIFPGAPTNSLTIDNTGNIGLGKWRAATNLHIYDADSAPTIRFENNNYVWDLSGSGSSFTLNNGTTEKTPFQVVAGAESDSLVISTEGKVGIGTQAPQAELHVEGDAFVNGDIVLEGYLSERSDAAAKENFNLVNGSQILAQLVEIPISTWNYKDDAATKHVGPMAQDFYGSFGVGKDDKHLSALDVNGVALASIQELNRVVEEKEMEIRGLKSDVQELTARIQAVESGNSSGKLNLILPFVFGFGGMLIGALFLSKRQ